MNRPSLVHPSQPDTPKRHAIDRCCGDCAAVFRLRPNRRILVHKDPNCGCCEGWVQHMKAAGFAVTVKEVADLEVVRKRLGVPSDLAACHTAEVGGYLIEGHVPALAVQRLLEHRPAAVGLSVPGMPAGSPGMEGGVPQKYDVVLFGPAGRQPFMRFVGSEVAG